MGGSPEPEDIRGTRAGGNWGGGVETLSSDGICRVQGSHGTPSAMARRQWSGDTQWQVGVQWGGDRGDGRVKWGGDDGGGGHPTWVQVPGSIPS